MERIHSVMCDIKVRIETIKGRRHSIMWGIAVRIEIVKERSRSVMCDVLAFGDEN